MLLMYLPSGFICDAPRVRERQQCRILNEVVSYAISPAVRLPFACRYAAPLLVVKFRKYVLKDL